MIGEPAFETRGSATSEAVTRVMLNSKSSQSRTQINVRFLIVLIALSFVVLPACIPSVVIGPCEPGAMPGMAEDTSWLGPDIAGMNTRMEVTTDPSLTTSMLWLRACLPGQQNCTTEKMTVRWDNYLVDWSYSRDATCDFSSLPENLRIDDCEHCNYCIGQGQICSALLFEPTPKGTFGPSVVRYEGFVTDSDGPLLVANLDFNSGCPNPLGTRNEFTPSGRATYHVLAAQFASYNSGCDQRRILAEKKIVVISDIAGRSTHPLKPHTDSQSPLAFYKGTVGTDPDWDVSFSSHLRVTKVRILRGIVMRDPKTMLFALDETSAKLVHPSRIVLFPNFRGSNSVFSSDTYRCYADTSEDGNFDLLRHCLHDSPYMPGNVVHQSVLANPAHLQNLPTDILTWFVEFNPAEGGDAPSLEPNEVLAIEFTIEPV